MLPQESLEIKTLEMKLAFSHGEFSVKVDMGATDNMGSARTAKHEILKKHIGFSFQVETSKNTFL